MTEQQKIEINAQITALEMSLTGDMMKDMEVKDKIHNLKLKRDGIKPMDSHFECEGCGS